MSLILNALRKLEQQDAFSSQKPTEDPQADNAESMGSADDGEQLTLAPIVEEPLPESPLDSWAHEVHDANEITALGSSDGQSGDDGVAVDPVPDEIPTDSEPQEPEEFEEDFNIPATDVGSEPALEAWATESTGLAETTEMSAHDQPEFASASADEAQCDTEPLDCPPQDCELELSNADLADESKNDDLARRNDFVTEVVEAEFNYESEDSSVEESLEQQDVEQFDESLPFYNPVVDAVDLDDLADQATLPEESVADEWATEDSTTSDEPTATIEAAETIADPASDGAPAERGIYEDEHYFFDEEPVVDRDAASEVSSETNLEFDADGVQSDVHTELPSSYDAVANDPMSIDEFSSDHAPWAEMPTGETPVSLPTEYENWDSPQPQSGDPTLDEWHTEGSSIESDDRTVAQIEDELDHCNDLALSAVGERETLPDVEVQNGVGSDASFEDLPIGTENIDTTSHYVAQADLTEEELAASSAADSSEPDAGSAADAIAAESTAADADPTFVSPSDFERQILERLTNSQYEQRFNDVFDQIEPLVGGRDRICIAVVAPQPSDVTGRLAAHLAVVAASHRRRRVQLIDANEDRELTLHFCQDGQPGLRGVISEGDGGSMHVRTSVPGMEFLPAGISAPGEFRTVIEGDPSRFQNGIAQSVNEFEITVVDAGGVVGAPANSIAAIADVVLLIAETGQTTSTQLADAEQRLKAAGAKNVGCVLSGEYATKV